MLKICQEVLQRDSVHAVMEDAEISSEKRDICSMFVMTLEVYVLGKQAVIHSVVIITTGCVQVVSKKDVKQE